MTEIPQRASLVAQAAEILLGRIRSGQWNDRLPAERALAEQLQISRSTLRAALQSLRRDGFVEVRRKRYWIRNRAARSKTKHKPSRLIAWLSPEPLERLPQFKLSQQDELRRRLHGLGYALEVHTDPRLHDQPISKALEETIRLSGAGCWVLNMTTAVVQRWFSERGVPSVVAGTRHAGVKLPSIDWDYRAVSRHAAGMFLRMGHRRVALLVPRSSLGGDEISRAGFLEAFQESGTTGVESRVVTHNGTVRGICSALDGLFSSETPPTGLYLFSAHSVLTTISHLIQRNIRVPRDVSVISRHDDAFLHELTPSIAAYEFPITRYAARLSQMAVRVAKVGSTSMRHVLLMGEFRNGESLARVP